ncbi:hypothetical protein KDH_29600 [Dictyobacter sp. S3.2.2.5]|uniref:Uncharacterized protein n=2 Tax=Dictyobacter halimunensis TaxID=3026934 RepID=A0ABQ6FPB3_9CHLR|nr:hypothetical protein KDH_29600 [Dictyobacter sp. S3.2.2.5]
MAEIKLSERIRQQQREQQTFRNDMTSDKVHLSRQALSLILLAIIVAAIIGIVVLYQFLH